MEELKNTPSSGEEHQEEAAVSKEHPLEFVKNLNEKIILPDLAEEPLERDPVQKAANLEIFPEESTNEIEECEIIPTGSEKPKKVVRNAEHHFNAERGLEDSAVETGAETEPAGNPTKHSRQKEEHIRYSTQQLIEMTFSAVVDAVGLLLQQDILPQPRDIDTLKAAFERKRNAIAEQKNDEEKRAYQEAVIQESRLNDLVSAYQTRYKEQLEVQARQEEEAFSVKSSLLERFQNLIQSNEEFGAMSRSFREIEAEWRSAGRVPENKAQVLQDEYSALCENFYDLKQINDEFRDYDFRKNLEAKEELIRRAEELSKSDNTSAANREISELHARWKEIGPVAKELREDLWDKFAAASKEIRTRHQDFFNSRKEEEGKNLEEKKKLCMEVEDIPYDTLTTIKLWNRTKETIIALQARWKEIGLVPRNETNSIYKRFRGACDVFFSKKALFFKELHDQQDENYRLKTKLVEEAESLANSTEWEKTAQRLKELQAQWKEIGPVSPKFKDIWDRFRQACNTFFDARKKATSEYRKESSKYTEEKKKLLNSAKGLLARDETENRNTIREELNVLLEEFKKGGNTANSFKRRIHKEFYDTVNEIFKKWKLDRNSRRMDSFTERVEQLTDSGDLEKLRNEMTYLARTREHTKEEIKNNEDKLQLMTSSSQWGNSVLKEMEKKVEVLRKEAELIEEKIILVRKKMADLREQKGNEKTVSSSAQEKKDEDATGFEFGVIESDKVASRETPEEKEQ